MKKFVVRATIVTLLFVLGLTLGMVSGLAYPRRYFQPVIDARAINADPAYQVVTDLRTIAGTEDPVEASVAYFDAHKDAIRAELNEQNDDRLRALYSMSIVHLTHPYGLAPVYQDIHSWLNADAAHCGTFPYAQIEINRALGLTSRLVTIPEYHGWVEVLIDGHWESFDSTTDVWVSTSLEQMLSGAERKYRMLYSPADDGTLGWSDSRALRHMTPHWGIFYFSDHAITVSDPFFPA